eukprot:11935916-Alexandrium_andersonii.AAC.1
MGDQLCPKGRKRRADAQMRLQSDNPPGPRRHPACTDPQQGCRGGSGAGPPRTRAAVQHARRPWGRGAGG